jgi:hypothetical protein
MERSHVPLNKWVLAYRLICSSKKGMSAHQLHRMLDVTYKTAWFMAHRIRESMTDTAPSPIGGANKIASRKSYLATDENPAYTKLGKEFSGHGTVNHSANEYARLGGFIHVNSAENYFSIFKRGVIGTFHHISEAHLRRYLAEFDFRYNNRSGLGVEDNERSKKAISGAAGKRLFYQEPRPAPHA